MSSKRSADPDGLPERASEAHEASLPAWVPQLRERPLDLHKGTAGRLLIVGGSRGMTGAVILAQRAALRCGAGLVTCAVPRGLQTVFEVRTTEAMTLPLGARDGETLDAAAGEELRPALDAAHALCIGPGLGRSKGTRSFMERLLEELEAPYVLDADALFHTAALRAGGDPALPAGGVLTPHRGELRRWAQALELPDDAPRDELARRVADACGVVVIAKGPRTAIVEPGGELDHCPAGNPGLATGGSGDVLAGVVAALLAGGAPPGDAARLGAWLHGRAADLAAYGESAGTAWGRPPRWQETRTGLGEEGLLPSDVADALPRAILELRRAHG